MNSSSFRTVVLLDWDGPLSNSRTWGMPFNLDPVAVLLLNDLYKTGCLTVLTSTIRSQFKNRAGAQKFMAERGIQVRWFSTESVGFAVNDDTCWRTDSMVGKRDWEFGCWHAKHAIHVPLEFRFMAVDDEKYCPVFKYDYGVFQPSGISCNEGIDHLALYEFRKFSGFK